MYYLTKCTDMPPSKLIGNWISLQEPVDIEVTVSDNKIILKKGRLVKEYNYEVTKFLISTISYKNIAKKIETLPGVIGLSTVSKNDPYYNNTLMYSMYFFVDDTHILIAIDPFPDQASDYNYNPERNPLCFI
jgi:hypothetical protein